MSFSPAASEEEEMKLHAKKPALSPLKPSTTTAAKSPSKSIALIPVPQPRTSESSIPVPQPRTSESSEEEEEEEVEEEEEEEGEEDPREESSDTVPPAALATKSSDSEYSCSSSDSDDSCCKPASHKKLLADPKTHHSRRQCVWSKDAELVLLNGLVDYTRKKNYVPSAAIMDAFHLSIQKSLNMDVSNTQLSDKIRRLKRKYLDSSSSSTSVDQDVIKLCNQIWGSGKKLVNSDNGKAEKYFEDEVTAKEQKTGDEQDNLLVDEHSHALLRELVLKTGTKLTPSVAGEAVALVDGAKAEEILGKHNKLALLEVKNDLRRMDLMQKTVKLFMEAVEKLV